ncbi:unnamed protein product [Brassica oleracea]
MAMVGQRPRRVEVTAVPILLIVVVVLSDLSSIRAERHIVQQDCHLLQILLPVLLALETHFQRT